MLPFDTRLPREEIFYISNSSRSRARLFASRAFSLTGAHPPTTQPFRSTRHRRALLLCSLLYCAHSSCCNIRAWEKLPFFCPSVSATHYFIQPYKDFFSAFETPRREEARALPQRHNTQNFFPDNSVLFPIIARIYRVSGLS